MSAPLLATRSSTPWPTVKAAVRTMAPLAITLEVGGIDLKAAIGVPLTRNPGALVKRTTPPAPVLFAAKFLVTLLIAPSNVTLPAARTARFILVMTAAPFGDTAPPEHAPT